MSRPVQVTGRAWVLLAPGGRLTHDIDTDMIFHNRFLHLTDVAQMGQHALGNLDGWQDWAPKVQSGDIIIAGRNFGAGSSRQQAVDCFRALSVGALLAESFGAIYKRNAINSGLPLLTLAGLTGLVEMGAINTGDMLELDLTSGRVAAAGRELALRAEPFSRVQMDIYQAGDLFAYGELLAGAAQRKS
jgi:3-isopropylmalate/(R)-2-methylmalate dehydratase small subunit